MPVVRIADVPSELFRGGATYQTIVGDQLGSTPIRVGLQTSPPGYKTPLHSHPYMETVTVLDGEGEAWLQDGDRVVELRPGTTLVFPAHLRHWFRALGTKPLVTLGVHASPHRIVNVHGD
jgi:quercetin dioxygenase-like cupin family protein